MKNNSVSLWRERIARHGLGDLMGLCLDVLQPLSPFAGQMLWVMQPTLGLLVDREQVARWATLLEDPQGIDRLREQLLTEESHD